MLIEQSQYTKLNNPFLILQAEPTYILWRSRLLIPQDTHSVMDGRAGYKFIIEARPHNGCHTQPYPTLGTLSFLSVLTCHHQSRQHTVRGKCFCCFSFLDSWLWAQMSSRFGTKGPKEMVKDGGVEEGNESLDRGQIKDFPHEGVICNSVLIPALPLLKKAKP